jgi:hypothetical protein
VIFKAINFNEADVDMSLNPSNGVVRYEFIEAIVRIAIEKYMIKGTAATEQEALKQLLSQVLLPQIH